MSKTHHKIAIWLFVMCAMVFLMVVVGGVTRLTESGLSMVNWRPVSGVIPPTSEAEWMEEFTAYQQFPEYQKINAGMSLDAFKAIFYWEFSHRLLGRLIGLSFFIPFMFFLIKGGLERKLKLHLSAMLLLGGTQGLLGWWMVKSGLVDNPDVSHYRLTAHLGLAVLIYIYMFWIATGLKTSKAIKYNASLTRMLFILCLCVFAQILLGGMVAGLNAGLVYNEWPLMGEGLVPDEFQKISFFAALESPVIMQFIHRMLAYLIVIIAMVACYQMHRHTRILSYILFAAIIAQILLGILTLIHAVPISLAALHQAGAIIVLSTALLSLRKCP